MTGYVKLISTTGSNFARNNGGWTWEARGTRHFGDITPDVCYGTSYNAHILWSTGDVRWEKEQWHDHITTDYHPSNSRYCAFDERTNASIFPSSMNILCPKLT